MPGFRKYARVPENCVVEISNDVIDRVSVKTKDISKDGMFVQSKELQELVSIGDAVDARLVSNGKELEKTLMRVVRTTDEGIAFSFE